VSKSKLTLFQTVIIFWNTLDIRLFLWVRPQHDQRKIIYLPPIPWRESSQRSPHLHGMGSCCYGPGDIRAGVHPVLELPIARARAEGIVAVRWWNHHAIDQNVNIHPRRIIKSVNGAFGVKEKDDFPSLRHGKSQAGIAATEL
jgi:hypothetical protein